MSFQLQRKQIFMLLLAAVLALASYFIPLPPEPGRHLTTPGAPELREPASTPSLDFFAVMKRR
jgi:hypothetical protein